MSSSNKDHTYKNPTHRLSKLPLIETNCFEYGAQMGYCGSIFTRRVMGVLGAVYTHYAFFYGIDSQNVIWLIERSNSGIRCISLDDFKLSENASYNIQYLEKDSSKKEEILKRANKVKNDIYGGGKNNCEHFVNYCVFGKHESKQAEITKGIVNAAISVYETLIVIRYDDKSFKILKENIDNIRKLAELPRPKEIEKIMISRGNRKANNKKNIE